MPNDMRLLGFYRASPARSKPRLFISLVFPSVALASLRCLLLTLVADPKLFLSSYSFVRSLTDVFIVTTGFSVFVQTCVLVRHYCCGELASSTCSRVLELSMAFCFVKFLCCLLQPPPLPAGAWGVCILAACSGFSAALERWSFTAYLKRIREWNLADREVETPESGEQAQLQNGHRTNETRQHMFRLLGLAGEFRGWVVAGCLALFFRLPFSIAIPHFVSEGIGGAIDHQSMDPVVRANAAERVYNGVLLIVICGTIDAILDFFNFQLFVVVKQKVIRALKLRLFENVMRQELSFFDSEPTGNLMSRLTSDTTEMSGDISFVFRFSIESVVRITGVAGYMFYCSWRLALLTCTLIPFNAKIQRIYAIWLHRNAKRSQDSLAMSNEIAHEVISGVQTVKAFAKERFELHRYANSVQRYYELGILQGMMESLNYMIVSTFLMNCVVQAALVGYGAFLVWHGAMGTDSLVAFLLYRANLQGEVGNLLNNYSSLLRGAGAASRVFQLLDRTSHLHQGEGHFDTEALGHVQFFNVDFAYASRAGTAVLCGFTLEALPGQSVALVGPSGAGKSTVFHLLSHFYEASRGRVLLDGQDVRTLDKELLAAHVGLVSQEPMLFRGTVEENIRYSKAQIGSDPFTMQSTLSRYWRLWKESDGAASSQGLPHTPSEKCVEEAARAANAHDFILELQNGYSTDVGERGCQLSGGQKQRIAIARAVMQNPRVLLLDEATSALDTESERLVQEALDRAMKERTTLVIAHRLSTVTGADLIAVVEKGRVVETGTHQSLLDAGGRYSDLWQRQHDVNAF